MMDKHAPIATDEAIIEASSSVPYAGTPGQTRYDSVHLVQPDGSLRSVAVCRAVNVQTHPELAQRAMSGTLHRFDDGSELAMPFVYHDPDARKFALVIPPMLAHTELKEWSKLMAEIADDTRHPVPAYVRESSTVLGLAALSRFLNESDAASIPPEAVVVVPQVQVERESLLLQRERELSEQERGLIRLAEQLTAREGELLREREQLATARVDLEIREQELQAARARASQQPPPRPSAGSWSEPGGFDDPSEATIVADISRDAAVSATFTPGSDRPAATSDSGTVVVRAPASEADANHHALPPPLTRRSAAPPPLPGRPLRGGPPPLHLHREQDDELTVVARAEDVAHMPPRLPPRDPERVTDATSLAEPVAAPELEPPEYFLSQRAGHMALSLAQDELWLFVHVGGSRADAFRRGAELMLQYAESDGHPVVVLSLVDDTSDEPYAIRLALDGRAESDLRVMEHLSRSFRARVALYVDGAYALTVTVSTLREGVAEAILAKLSQLPHEVAGGSTASDALLRVLRAPPPLWNEDLPFGPARREAPTTVAVLAAVEQLSSWLRPEKLDEATLSYSVPPSVIDASTRRVLRAAVVFGIALPEALLDKAVSHHIASDGEALVREQLRAFRSRVRQGENDLGAEATARNWQTLLRQAESLGVELDDEDKLLSMPPSGVRAANSVRPTGSERPLEHLSTADLRARLDEPRTRLEAIVELCERGHPGAIDPIFAVLPELSPDETAVATARLLTFGEAAGDALIVALDAPTEALRQCAALGLGRLRLRRALMPLLRRLEVEPTPMWSEVARALGDFGPSALRNAAWAVPGAGEKDRLSAALAHLANHGASREVEKLENDPDPDIAQAARRAMSRRSRMEWEDLAVREQRTLADSNPATRLSQAFYARAPKAEN